MIDVYNLLGGIRFIQDAMTGLPFEPKVIMLIMMAVRIQAAGRPDKPIMQPRYVDLSEDAEPPPQPIHLEFCLGVTPLRSYLRSFEGIGVNHLALNQRINQADIEETLKRLADDILPDFVG